MPGTDNFDFDLSAQTAFEQMAGSIGGGAPAALDPSAMAGMKQSMSQMGQIAGGMGDMGMGMGMGMGDAGAGDEKDRDRGRDRDRDRGDRSRDRRDDGNDMMNG